MENHLINLMSLEKIVETLSFIEAKIDFPEEDLPEENLKKIKIPQMF